MRANGHRWKVFLLVGLLIAAGAVWALFPRDSSEPARVTADEYVYATSGFESVDALGGARHDYPPSTGIEVEETAGGRCRVISWRPLEGRVTEWKLCGNRLVSIHESHDFFGNPDERTYRCEPGSSIRDGWTCSYGGATETATGGVVGREDFDGQRVEHVRLDRRIEGDVEGTGVRQFWLRPDGFPVKLTGTTDDVSPSPIGDVRYLERFVLTLESTPED
ncbi:MAG: hypothetical protein U0R51_06180 [Solirubrobacterales bacterium]